MARLTFAGELSKYLVAALLVSLVMTACGKKDPNTGKPPANDPPGGTQQPSPRLESVNISVDAKGNVVITDSHGNPGRECSDDPKSDNVCSIFAPKHKVLVKSVTPITIINYTGSPKCSAVLIKGVWRELPSTCKH